MTLLLVVGSWCVTTTTIVFFSYRFKLSPGAAKCFYDNPGFGQTHLICPKVLVNYCIAKQQMALHLDNY